MTARPLTVAQLATYRQCSDTFIYDRINAGQLRAFKLGGKLWRITPEAVAEYEIRAYLPVMLARARS
jgi:excisionase family DNA binding protein